MEYQDNAWPPQPLQQAGDQAGEYSLSPAGLMPKRNPNLIDRVARLWTRNQPTLGPQPDQQQTTQSGIVTQALQSVFDQYFRSSSDRLAIYKDVDEMDAAAEEASVALDTIADNVTTSEDGQMRGFRILTTDTAVEKLLNQVIETVRLDQCVYSIVRNAVKYGDVFMEVVVNGEGEVVALKQLPPSTMWRNQDPKGVLKLGKPLYDKKTGACLNTQMECAYEQRAEDTQTVVASFYPWQIVHGRFNHDGFSIYGRSLMRVTRIIWKKLKAEEEGLIMGRLVRAMLKLVFYVDTTGQSPQQKTATLQAFKSSVATRSALDGQRENPFYVLTDFFLSDGHYRIGGEIKPSRTRVDVLDPKNEGLNQIADVKYFHRKMLATLRVPPGHMGFEEQINAKSTLTQQDVQYIRFLRSVQQFVGVCLQQLFDTALLLADLDPHEHQYEIKWPLLSAADEAAAAQAELQRAQAMAIYLGNSQSNMTPVLSPEYIQRATFAFADEDVALETERLDAAHEKALERNQKEADQQFDNSSRLIETQAKTAAKYATNPKIPGGSARNASTGKGEAPKKATATPKRKAVGAEAEALAGFLQMELEQALEQEMNGVETEHAENLSAAEKMAQALRNLFPAA
jgi:hypothetical protein